MILETGELVKKSFMSQLCVLKVKGVNKLRNHVRFSRLLESSGMMGMEISESDGYYGWISLNESACKIF